MKRISAVRLTSIFLVTFLISCGPSGSVIITGNIRPAIDPAQVKLYLDPPTKFETIGLVEASDDVGFSKQAAQDRVVDKLKKEAAKRGANGILLGSTGSQQGATAGYYSNGFFYAETGERIVAQGKLIYVTQE